MEQERRIALITGSAKGLGKTAAIALADAGYDIVLNYVHSEQEAHALRSQIIAKGVRCEAIYGDISKRNDVKKLVASMNEKIGPADVVINNAGPFIRERRLFREYEEDEIMYLLDGNLTGVILLDHLVLPAMREKGWGRIIHYGFGHAEETRAWPHRAVYAAAKVGLVSFTKTLAVEEAQYGITVNMICPGDIRGPFKEAAIDDVREMSDEETPRGRPGTGEDVERVITFLCQEKSDFVTGNIITISGGLDPIRNSIR